MRALRLIIEYKDIRNANTKIEVWQEGYASATAHRDGTGTPLVIDWGDNGSQTWPVIYGSTATVRFYADSALEFSDLFNSDPYRNLVKIYKETRLIWTGFILGDKWDEPRTCAPIPVQFVAGDGLALLSDIDYVNEEGQPIYETCTVQAMIEKCLLQTGLELDLFSAIDWQNNLSKTYLELTISTYAFEGMTYAEILENLLFGCRVKQRDGAWYVISYSNYARSSIVVTIPASLVDDFHVGDFHSGDFRTRIPGSDTRYLYPITTDFWFENTLDIEFLPAIKFWKINEDYRRFETLVVNGDFTDSSLGWTINNTTANVFMYDRDAEKYVCFLMGKEAPASPLSMIMSMDQQIAGFEIASSQHIRIKFKYGLLGLAGLASRMYAEIRLNASGTNYYADYVYDPTNERIDLVWSTTRTMIRLGAKIDGGAIGYDDPVADFVQKIPGQLQSFDHETTTIPDAGTLRIFLYVPYTSATSIGGALYTEVAAHLLTKDGDKYPADKTTTVVNDLNYSYIPEDLDFVTTDYPIADNIKMICNSGLSFVTTKTHSWRREGATTYYSFNEFRARLIMSMQRLNRQNYQATLADCEISLRSVITDADAGNIKLLENGVSYNDYMQTIEGQFTEILTPNLT